MGPNPCFFLLYLVSQLNITLWFPNKDGGMQEVFTVITRRGTTQNKHSVSNLLINFFLDVSKNIRKLSDGKSVNTETNIN